MQVGRVQKVDLENEALAFVNPWIDVHPVDDVDFISGQKPVASQWKRLRESPTVQIVG